ncbi:DUF11 domain-containing protein [bacterium]|nr:DUF11 domain-containing protein [bacterium]
MRRGTWILAVAGALGLQAGGAGAAEPGIPAGMGQGAGVPSRYSRPSSTATKNFYDELFGDVKELNGGTATPAAPAKGPSARPASAPPSKKIPLDEQSKVFPAATAAPAGIDVIHADFDKSKGSESFIQPVRATSEADAAASSTATPVASDAVGQSPNVVLEWVKKSDINVGQECELQLVAKNIGNGPAAQVKLEATFPTTVRLTSADPKPATSTDKLAWTFDGLPAGAEKRITVKLIPSRRGDLGTSAQVSYSSQSAHVFKVEEPLLKVAIKGPKDVLLGDPASQMITISNPGTGVAHNVKLEAVLSEGLEHPRGERLTIEIGSIAAGESQQVRLGMSAAKGGVQTLQLVASSSTEATAALTEKINVIAPSLAVNVTGPGLRYMGRAATYKIDVKNDGTVANNNVRVQHKVPEGFQFVSADHGGKYDADQRTVHWFIGRMEGNQQSHVSCELSPIAIGDFSHAVSVVSDAGVKADGKFETTVKGAASLSTEIVDLDDPVEVGVETAWEVRVKNDGSKAASNIAVVCELPENLQVIAAKGPTQAVADQRMIIFKGLQQLAPGQQAIYRIQVKGVVEGTHRLRARVTSDSLDEPLLMEEATKFYSDTKK